MSSKLKSLAFALFVLANIAGCKKAGYEVLGVGQNKDDPQQVAPQPAPVLPAKVVVVLNNNAVTTVPAGTAVAIQPSGDTAYGPAVANCPNPGFTKIVYTTGDGNNTLTVNRPTGCETPGSPYTYTVPGTYTITMTATTNDGKTVQATTSIVVTQSTSSVPYNQNGGYQQGNYYYGPCGCKPPPPPCGCQ